MLTSGRVQGASGNWECYWVHCQLPGHHPTGENYHDDDDDDDDDDEDDGGKQITRIIKIKVETNMQGYN